MRITTEILLKIINTRIEKQRRHFPNHQRVGLLVLTFAVLAVPGYAQITPSDDGYVLAANPTTRYGGAATLAVQSASSTSFIRFDLAAVPSGYTSANIAKAT